MSEKLKKVLGSVDHRQRNRETNVGEKNPMFGKRGSKSPLSKLSEEQVKQVLQGVSEGKTIGFWRQSLVLVDSRSCESETEHQRT
jgi:hypothetical protein